MTADDSDRTRPKRWWRVALRLLLTAALRLLLAAAALGLLTLCSLSSMETVGLLSYIGDKHASLETPEPGPAETAADVAPSPAKATSAGTIGPPTSPPALATDTVPPSATVVTVSTTAPTPPKVDSASPTAIGEATVDDLATAGPEPARTAPVAKATQPPDATSIRPPDPIETLESAGTHMEQGLDLLAAPTAAVVGQAFTVDYVVLRRSGISPERVATAVRSLGADVTPVAGGVAAYPVMNAELVADAADFTVLALTSSEQVFAGQDSLGWRWRLTPRRSGRLYFTVKVSAVIETAAGSKRRDAVKSQDVMVEARAQPLVWGGVLLAAAVLGLLLVWLRRRRRRRPDGAARSLTPAMVAELQDLVAPLMDTENERRAWVFQALGDCPLRERIRFGGSGADFSAQLIETLWKHGALPDGTPALRALLMTLRRQMGGERQRRIDTLVDQLWPR